MVTNCVHFNNIDPVIAEVLGVSYQELLDDWRVLYEKGSKKMYRILYTKY